MVTSKSRPRPRHHCRFLSASIFFLLHLVASLPLPAVCSLSVANPVGDGTPAASSFSEWEPPYCSSASSGTSCLPEAAEDLAQAEDQGISLLTVRSTMKKKEDLMGPGEQAHSSQTHSKRRGAVLAQEGASVVEELNHSARGSSASSTLVSLGERAGTTVVSKEKDALTARGLARARFRSSATSVSAEMRTNWVRQAKQSAESATNSLEGLDSFVESVKRSETTCSAKVLQLFQELKDLSSRATSLVQQQEAHQEVLSSATRDLQTTQQAIDDAKRVEEGQRKICEQDRADARTEYIQYTKELRELQQIANPSARADLAGVGHTVDAIATAGGDAANETFAGGDEVDSVEATALLEVSSSTSEAVQHLQGSNGSPEAAAGQWSEQQCVAFLRLQQKRQQQDTPGDTADLISGLNTTAVCETKLTQLEAKFEQAYKELSQMRDAKAVDKDNKECDDIAKTALDTQLMNLEPQREHISDKIEESEASVAAMSPSIDSSNRLLEVLRARIAATKQECTEVAAFVPSLSALTDLIAQTAHCPGIGSLNLDLPSGICHTNGITCTWDCSDHGQIFAVGEKYGHYKTALNVPREGEVEGRALCEEACIQDTHCVGFSHFVENGECSLKYDVLGGQFSPLPKKAHSNKIFYACFVKERVNLVNEFRDKDHPQLSHHAITAFWAEKNAIAEGLPLEFMSQGLDLNAKRLLEVSGHVVNQKVDWGKEGLASDFERSKVISSLPEKTGVDACGCPDGTGFDSEYYFECYEGEAGFQWDSTSAGEARCCEQGKWPLAEVGDHEAKKPPTCMDFCGCQPGEGWSLEEEKCVPGEVTDAFEDECCFMGFGAYSVEQMKSSPNRTVFPLKMPQRWPDTGVRVCADACGCTTGSAFRRGRCQEGYFTTKWTVECCALGRVPVEVGNGTAQCMEQEDAMKALAEMPPEKEG